MSFSAGKRDKLVKESLTPGSFFTDLGDIQQGPGGAYFVSDHTPDAFYQIGDAAEKTRGLVQGIPTQTSLAELVNGPMYESTRKMLRRPIEEQKVEDEKELTNQLSARNQLGSSYDALMRNNFAKRYDNMFAQADEQSRGASVNYHTQMLNNVLNSIAGLGNRRSQAIEEYFAPAKLAMGYQQALSPLQQTAAAHYSGRKTPFENLMSLWGTNAQVLASAYGGA